MRPADSRGSSHGGGPLAAAAAAAAAASAASAAARTAVSRGPAAVAASAAAARAAASRASQALTLSSAGGKGENWSGRLARQLRRPKGAVRFKFLFTIDEIVARLPAGGGGGGSSLVGGRASLVWVRGSHVVRLGDVPIGAGRGTEGAARWALPESLVVTLFAKQQLHSRRGAAAGEGGGGRSYEPKLSELVLTVLPPTSHGPGAGAGGDGGDACTSPAVLRFVAKLDLAAHATVAGAPSQLRLAFDGGDGGALELAITARWLREVAGGRGGSSVGSPGASGAGSDDDDASSVASLDSFAPERSAHGERLMRTIEGDSAAADPAAIALRTPPPSPLAPGETAAAAAAAAAAGAEPLSTRPPSPPPERSWVAPALGAGASLLRAAPTDVAVVLQAFVPVPLRFVREALCGLGSGGPGQSSQSGHFGHSHAGHSGPAGAGCAGLDTANGALGARLAPKLGYSCTTEGRWLALAAEPPDAQAGAARDAGCARAQLRTLELLLKLPPVPLLPAQTRLTVRHLCTLPTQSAAPLEPPTQPSAAACVACAAGDWCEVHCFYFERAAQPLDVPHGKHTTLEEAYLVRAARPSSCPACAPRRAHCARCGGAGGGVWVQLKFGIAFTRRPPMREAAIRAQLALRSEATARVLLDELAAVFAASPEATAAVAAAAAAAAGAPLPARAASSAAAGGDVLGALAARLAAAEAEARLARDEARELRAENGRLRALCRGGAADGAAEATIRRLEAQLAAERRERARAEEEVASATGEMIRSLVRQLQLSEHQASALGHEYASASARVSLNPLARGGHLRNGSAGGGRVQAVGNEPPLATALAKGTQHSAPPAVSAHASQSRLGRPASAAASAAQSTHHL